MFKNTTFISSLLSLVFVISCLVFTANAEPTTAVPVVTTEVTSEITTAATAPSTEQTTPNTTVPATVASTTRSSVVRTTVPKTTKEEVSSTRPTTQANSGGGAIYQTTTYDVSLGDQQTEKKPVITEPPTSAKNINDYGSANIVMPIKIVSLILMLLSALALLYVNLFYKKHKILPWKKGKSQDIKGKRKSKR